MDFCINLLPPEISALQEKKRKGRQIATAGVTILLVLALAFGALVTATSQARTRGVRLQHQRQALESRVQAMEQYALPQAQLKLAEGTVRQAVGTPPDWEAIITQIGFNIPADVWLTELSAAYKADGKQNSTPVPGSAQPAPGSGELVIRGWASGHTSVARWLEDIRRVTGISDTRCSFSSEENFQEKPLVQFEIKAALLPGNPNQQALKEGGCSTGG